MATRLFPPFYQFEDADGKPLVGGTLEFYSAGTTTPKDTYADAGLTIPNGTITLNDLGRSPVAIFAGTGDYRVILKDADGVAIGDEDPVEGGPLTVELPRTVFVERQSAILADKLDFVLPAGHEAFQITIPGLVVNTDNTQMGLQVSIDGGASFSAGAGDYEFRLMWNATAATLATSVGNSSYLPLCNFLDGTSLLIGEYTFSVGTALVAPSLIGRATYVDNGGGGAFGGLGLFGGRRNAAGVVNAIRIFPATGTFSGPVSLSWIR